MKKRHIIIYGGSSLISFELIHKLKNDCDEISIFCRDTDLVENHISQIENVKFNIYEVDLLDLKKNISLIESIKVSVSGVIWIAGYTGNADTEFLNSDEGEKNIKINLLNPILLINKIIPKMIENEDSFVVALTSVAGLRGRANRLFYSASKSGLISYLSGLRQKLYLKKINVITVIPGYIKTKAFVEGGFKAPFFLVSSPEKAANIIYKAIKKKKNIVYINSIWRIIMLIISIIPENLFKKFKF
jgi:decaprenylphospho-beta-D-erythro-pentofuranosid-2-ulose 2-reductase